ncbi:PASTA domain-containing protein [Rhizohabitans arisaemae]|uniref:PASTA domain-containing protein n=1 Tax=Rhizohabitans arisaemae TaxID=2720610 RepID=UPI0024B1689D|nr:PASTA domain-containing protein [Rhizohabitans arisaemae]
MAHKNIKTGCATLFVFALVVGGCMRLVGIGDGDEKTPAAAEPLQAPALIGKRLNQAETESTALGLLLTSEALPGSYCLESAKCVVYAMKPAPGTAVQPGSTLIVKILTDKESAFYRKNRTMPNVVGWSQSRATTYFAGVFGMVSDTLKESKSVPAGTYRVIAQFPKPGARLQIGQKIKLTVGYNLGSLDGPRNPDLRDRDRDRGGGGGGGGGGGICRRSRWC